MLSRNHSGPDARRFLKLLLVGLAAGLYFCVSTRADFASPNAPPLPYVDPVIEEPVRGLFPNEAPPAVDSQVRTCGVLDETFWAIGLGAAFAPAGLLRRVRRCRIAPRDWRS
jgi:hypothetical protein